MPKQNIFISKYSAFQDIPRSAAAGLTLSFSSHIIILAAKDMEGYQILFRFLCLSKERDLKEDDLMQIESGHIYVLNDYNNGPVSVTFQSCMHLEEELGSITETRADYDKVIKKISELESEIKILEESKPDLKSKALSVFTKKEEMLRNMEEGEEKEELRKSLRERSSSAINFSCCS